MKKRLSKHVLTFWVIALISHVASAQTTTISPQLRSHVLQGIESGQYASMFIAVQDGDNEECLMANSENHFLNRETKIDVSELLPVWVSLQMADMMDLGIQPDLYINELLDKSQRAKDKQFKKVKLLHLALQSSGLSEENSQQDDYCNSYEEENLSFTKRTIDFVPGMVYNQGSNDLYYLSKLLLKKYGLPCELYFNDHLFRKVSLTNTFVVNGGKIQSEEDNFEKGTFVSTPNDLIQLMKIQTGLKSIDLQPHVIALRKYRKETRFKNGLISAGWLVYQSDSSNYYYRFAQAEKMNIFMAFEPNSKKSVVIVSETKENLASIVWHIMLNEKLVPGNTHIPCIDISKCVGEYSANGEEFISVIKKNGKMVLYLNGEEAHVCHPYSGTNFLLSTKAISLQFEVNENDEVDALFLKGYSAVRYVRIN